MKGTTGRFLLSTVAFLMLSYPAFGGSMKDKGMMMDAPSGKKQHEKMLKEEHGMKKDENMMKDGESMKDESMGMEHKREMKTDKEKKDMMEMK
ncbi:MAG TPA: hypothetical protein DCO77_13845 [Nitrospiraceae bacterium]|nr:hypothetical protein [Nitrospiraceae bacterium]